jgi:type VI secretion system protein ImpE
VMGEPDEWLALLIESLMTSADASPGAVARAQELRERAFEAAPATPGSIDGSPFEWIADADMRLGPVCEAVINGRYYWVPFARLARIDLEPPADLRDVVWMPAHFAFTNGGDTVAVIPTRYQGSEGTSDAASRLARRTEWREVAPDVFHGIGQRVWTTEAGEHSIMDVRTVLLGDGAVAAAGEVTGA